MSTQNTSIENKPRYTEEEMLYLMYDEGIKPLADTVKATLGPNGCSVLIDNYGGNTFVPVVTKDGQTVATSMYAENWVSNAAMKLFIDGAQQTDLVAGDGTTSCIVIGERASRDIVKVLREHLTNKKPLDRYQIKKGMEDVIVELNNWVKENAKAIDENSKEAYQVALCASNGDEQVAKICIDYIKAVGVAGYPAIEKDLQLQEHEVNFIKGEHEFDIPLSSSELIPADERWLIVENPLFIVSNLFYSQGYLDFENKQTDEDNKFSKLIHRDESGKVILDEKVKEIHKTIHNIIDSVGRQRQIVIIGNGFSEEFIETFVRGQMLPGVPIPIILVQAPRMILKQELSDLALLLGTVFIENSNKYLLSKMVIGTPGEGEIAFGSAEAVLLNMNKMILKNPKGDKVKINKRIKMFENTVKAKVNTNTETIVATRKYINKLKGISATIKLGGGVIAVTSETRFRLVDAISSLRSAVLEGVLPGGGYAMWKAADEIASKKIHGKSSAYLMGRKFAIDALREPYRVLKSNSLFEPTINEHPEVTPYKDVWDSSLTYRVSFQKGIECAVSALLLVRYAIHGGVRVLNSEQGQ